MTIAEQIFEYVKRAPSPIQDAVLHFVHFLLHKVEWSSGDNLETTDWSNASLTYAMRGMEHEEGPTYTVADLKETYS